MFPHVLVLLNNIALIACIHMMQMKTQTQIQTYGYKQRAFKMVSHHNLLVIMHHLLYVTFFWNVAISNMLEIAFSMLIT